MTRHPRYRTMTTAVGVLTMAGAILAGDRGWIKADTAALLVPLGAYAVTRRRTDAQRLDYLSGIYSRLIQGVTVDVEQPARTERMKRG